MFTDRQDYLMQMIERLVAGIIEQVRRTLGGDPKQLEALERDCAQAMDDEFLELHARVAPLSSRSAADVIRPVTRLRTYAILLGGRTLLQHRRASLDPSRPVDSGQVQADAQRALELLLEATLASEVTDADRSLCPALFALVDAATLDPRYLEALVAVGEPA
jgi:hypothetical protein